MADMTNASAPVYKSLLQPDLIIGVPKGVFVAILCGAVAMASLFGLWFALSAVVFYAPCYFLSKEDPHMLSMAMGSLLQPDYLEG
jgi:type IV secretory pathway VirB3-like protein